MLLERKLVEKICFHQTQVQCSSYNSACPFGNILIIFYLNRNIKNKFTNFLTTEIFLLSRHPNLNYIL